MEKKALRKSLLQARQAIAPEIWQTKSSQLCSHLRSSSLFTQAQTVLGYFSTRQEPDLSFLFSPEKLSTATFPAATPTAKTWGFPRCVGKRLTWHIWSPDESLALQIGAYGILEPHPDAPTLAPDQVDLILVPAIACDTRGYRLGYGGGFYDRLLTLPAWAEKPTIGIVFESTYLPKLPEDEWDRPLKAVCTEKGLFFANQRSSHTLATDQ
jgi:5-formyltetrahydrofolate cyclo-ligase